MCNTSRRRASQLGGRGEVGRLGNPRKRVLERAGDVTSRPDQIFECVAVDVRYGRHLCHRPSLIALYTVPYTSTGKKSAVS